MNVFKSFILSVLASSSLVAGQDDGWFPIEKKPKIEEESTETDPSIWVLFSKTIDLEKILVRLPEDPSYKYTESGELEIRSERDGEIFELIVFKAGSDTPPISDEPFLSEGKWVHEHVVQTEQHIYLLRTYANVADSSNHKEFVSSFALE